MICLPRVTCTTILLSIVLFYIPGQAFAQSSSRGIVDSVPTVVPSYPARTYPAQPQPAYPAVQSQGAPVQFTPVQGSSTRQPVVREQNIQYGQPLQHQGSGSRRVSSQPMAVTTQVAPASDTFDTKLWNYLVRSKYKNWAPAPGQTDGDYPGESPHGAFLKMYLNRRAAGNPKTLPHGSIIVKENYSPAKKLAAITVMYKTKGYNKDANDWYWVKYNTNGTVATKAMEKGMQRLSGRVGGCIDCHGAAGNGDFAFFND